MRPRVGTLWIAALLGLGTGCDAEVGAPLVERSDATTSEVIFSPKPPDATHNLRVAELISGAERSIDVAMYSFNNAAVLAALDDAAARGVHIRFIYEGAKSDRLLDADARANSRSGRLEAAGIDVRYINTIMHHKFMIVDGPRDELGRASTASLATGSANWSNAAATRYDENTLFLRGHAELSLRMQAEFNLLWEHSRDFVSDAALPFVASEIAIRDADIVDSPATDALFTSANFDLEGSSTFTTTERSRVSDALISAIDAATDSIWIASGHLRHRGVAEALIGKAGQYPDMDIRVYLDAQEYVSAAAHAHQLDEREACRLAAADDESAVDDCLERGFRYGLAVAQAGVDVRYKYYAYRWAYPYAKQMHHKYLVIDGDELWTGSYNLSNNAEHHTMENMLWFSGTEHAGLIDAFAANFTSLWATGRDTDLLATLREEIETAETIPLVFEPMALEWQEITDLKALIRKHCPQVDSFAFRSQPESHLVCEGASP